MRKSRILVIGNTNAEIRTDIKRFPSGGDVVSGKEYGLACGGCGVNSSVALSKLGAEALCCSRVGDDAFSGLIKRCLEKYHVDTRFVSEKPGGRTRLSISAIDEWGRVSSIRFAGDCGDIGMRDLDAAFISYPDAVLLQYDLPAETIRCATEIAERHEIPVFIDGGPVSLSGRLDELRNVEIFMMDEKEAYAYTGISPDAVDTCGKACMAVAGKVKAKYIVLKLGERGAFFYDGMYFKFIPAYDVKKVDGSAAGDAFTASMVVEYMRSRDIRKACEFACLAGAMTVSAEGGVESIPTLSEILRFAEENGIELEF